MAIPPGGPDLRRNDREKPNAIWKSAASPQKLSRNSAFIFVWRILCRKCQVYFRLDQYSPFRRSHAAAFERFVRRWRAPLLNVNNLGRKRTPPRPRLGSRGARIAPVPRLPRRGRGGARF